MFKLDILSLNHKKEILQMMEKFKSSIVSGGFSENYLAISYPYEKYWIKDNPDDESKQVILTAVILYYNGGFLFIVDEDLLTYEILKKTYSNVEELHDFIADKLKIEWLSFSKGFLLEPVSIAKPWGEEIWYSGIEERGVSLVEQKERKVLLPYVLSLFPSQLVNGDEKNIILLKILNPLPDPECGDLYFELHEKKKEVYVVSEINADCYPNGVGRIKLGVNQQEYQKYSDEKKFRKSMLERLTTYKNTFDEIYKIIKANSYRRYPKKSVSPAQYFKLLKLLPKAIQKNLKEEYKKIEEFCHFEHIQIGDVLTVNSFVPHSLLHGVRVVEFQTPHYERLIISFNQKVVTQDHWDSEKAVACMDCSPQAKNSDISLIDKHQDTKVEKIATFENFMVKRVYLNKLHSQYKEIIKNRYFLIICLKGKIKLLFSDDSSVLLTKDKTFFVSAKCKKLKVISETEQSIYLKSIPLE